MNHQTDNDPTTGELQAEQEESFDPSGEMLTPEEAEYLRQRQRRNNRVTSLLVTCLVYAGLILILALLAIPVMQQDAPQIRARVMQPTDTQVTQQVTQTQRASPSAPSSSAQLITSASAPAPVHVPQTEVEVETLSIGDDMQLGMGFGGTGMGIGDAGLGNIPGGLRGRCTPEERMKRLREHGGNQEVADAVLKGLHYFKDNQNGDGSWGQGRHRAAMTGLVLLCFLAHCETPVSPDFGETVNLGLMYLISEGLDNDGYITRANRDPYEHAIATYALCEALTFAKAVPYEVPNLEEVCEKAIDIIITNQHPSGAWDYNYNTTGRRGGDTSILVWQMQALKAAELAGIEHSGMQNTVRKALSYLDDRAFEHGFHYTSGRGTSPPWRLVGAGTFVYQLWGRGNVREARNALRRIDRLDMDYNSSNALLYAWYYNANAAFQAGGRHWQIFNEKWRDTLLSGQREDGSWRREGAYGSGDFHRNLTTEAVGHRNEHSGDIYRTSLAVLQLCVYYRFLPTGR